MTQLHVKVTDKFSDRIYAAAQRVQLSMAAWVRLAIIEKLERDGEDDR